MGYNPSYKWINPTYPIYNWGYNPLPKWDEPPSGDTTSINRATSGVSENGNTGCFFLKAMGVSTGPQRAGFPGVTVVAYSIAIYT